MQNLMMKTYIKGQTIWNAIKDEKGQDLVEYAAVIALVVLALTGGMSTLANGINTAMTTLSGTLNTRIG